MRKPNPATANINQNPFVRAIFKALDEVHTIGDVGLWAETYKRLGDAFGKLGMYNRAIGMWQQSYETKDFPGIRRVLALHRLAFIDNITFLDVDRLVKLDDDHPDIELIPHWVCSALIGGRLRAKERHRQRVALNNQYPALRPIIGESNHILEICKRIINYAALERKPVLITGQTGTGKELVANALHACSPRSEGPFIRVNSANFSEGVFESEVFGHTKGAFTDAVRDRPGLIEAAHGGTLFLDEISQLPLNLQSKLLRVLEDKEVRRVGANESKRVDVRFIAASNRDLASLADEGRFLDDLYQRLQGLEIRLQPLLNRLGDLVLLARHFIQVHQLAPEAPPFSDYDILYWLRYFHLQEIVLQQVDLMNLTEGDVEDGSFLFTIGIAKSEIVPSFSLRLSRLSPQLWHDSALVKSWKGNVRGLEGALIRSKAEGDLKHRGDRPFVAGVIHRGEVDILSPCYTPTELQRHDWAVALDLCRFQKDAGRLMGIDDSKRASQLLKSLELSKKQRKRLKA
jgi:hypothetical protein